MDDNSYFDRYFPPWKKQVHDIVRQLTGLYLSNLPDFPYADNFEAGTSPIEMSRIILADLGIRINDYTNSDMP